MALPIHLADTHWETLHPPLLDAGSYAAHMLSPRPCSTHSLAQSTKW
ncbi:hypothetical protein [Streptomyces sp. NPDC057052]